MTSSLENSERRHDRLDITGSRHPAWLAQQGISLAFITYQSNRLLLLGLKPNGQLSAVLRSCDQPRTGSEFSSGIRE